MKQNSNRYWDDFYTGGNHLQIYDCYDNWLDNYTAYFKPDMCVLDLGCGEESLCLTLLGNHKTTTK